MFSILAKAVKLLCILIHSVITLLKSKQLFHLSYHESFWDVVVSYGPPWAHYLGGYQDRILGGPLGLPDLRCTVPDGVKHKDYRGEVLG
jgi:hypothetical protein